MIICGSSNMKSFMTLCDYLIGDITSSEQICYFFKIKEYKSYFKKMNSNFKYIFIKNMTKYNISFNNFKSSE